MDYKEKLAQSKKLFEQARDILNDPEADAEQKSHVQKMVEDGQRLKAEAFQLEQILEAAAEVETATQAMEEKAKDVAAQEAAAAENKDAPPVRELKSHLAGSEFKEDEWRDFLVSIWYAKHPDPQVQQSDPRLCRHKEASTPGHEAKQMVESVGASGGFLVPVTFLPQMQAALAENTIVRPRATVIRMDRRQVDIPVLDQTGTTAGRPHWYGGMLGYWEEEAAEKTITTPKFRKVSLVAHKFIMYTRASNELLSDSAISIGDFLAGPVGFGGCVAWNEDYSFLQGSGAGQPQGVLTAGCTITVNRTGNVPPIVYADLINMLEAFLPTGRGVWLVTQTGISNLMTIADAAGNYIWQPNAQAGTPQMLLGFPVIFTEKLPAVGTAGDVLLADFSYYLIGDRQAMTVDTTEYDMWRYDQTSWRAVHRVDGQPWLSVYLTYQDGATTVSPFVILGDKST